jgi:hypothetical protein
MSDMNVKQALEHIQQTMPDSEEKNYIVSFIQESPRGVVGKGK